MVCGGPGEGHLLSACLLAMVCKSEVSTPGPGALQVAARLTLSRVLKPGPPGHLAGLPPALPLPGQPKRRHCVHRPGHSKCHRKCQTGPSTPLEKTGLRQGHGVRLLVRPSCTEGDGEPSGGWWNGMSFPCREDRAGALLPEAHTEPGPPHSPLSSPRQGNTGEVALKIARGRLCGWLAASSSLGPGSAPGPRGLSEGRSEKGCQGTPSPQPQLGPRQLGWGAGRTPEARNHTLW